MINMWSALINVSEKRCYQKNNVAHDNKFRGHCRVSTMHSKSGLWCDTIIISGQILPLVISILVKSMFNPTWELALALNGSVEPDKHPTVVWPHTLSDN